MGKKKIVVFTGAGISRESGILTFRDCEDGLWNNYRIQDVATPEGWHKDRELVNNFYNERRAQLPTVHPNSAHKAVAELEKEYDVTVITQNVDDLHERGGSTNVIHLHGELTKARGCYYNDATSKWNVYDIGHQDINPGDKCKVSDSQLRPHICWFGEMPYETNEAFAAMDEAEIVVVIGTGFQIGYTIGMVNACPWFTPIYYIDPEPDKGVFASKHYVEYYETTATEGMVKLLKELNV